MPASVGGGRCTLKFLVCFVFELLLSVGACSQRTVDWRTNKTVYRFMDLFVAWLVDTLCYNNAAK